MSACPSWCVSGDDCGGDHWASPGSNEWPAVVPSAWPLDNTIGLTAFPTWVECDGSDPAVALYIHNEGAGDHVDITLDMTREEAGALVAHLTKALAAIES